MSTQSKSPEAVYIHIPFCTNKCYYCDFNSYVLEGQPVKEYLSALEREMERTVQQLPPAEIKTIFIGGGTPTVLLPEQMEQFLSLVRTYFPTTDQAEVTMEANPGTTDLSKLEVMKSGGINRLSFGVQSFDNNLLQKIGRIHNTDDVYRSIENAQKVGFENLSIDLMFGLPKQTTSILEKTIEEAMKLNLKHYSIYGLKVEENTLFHSLYQKDQLPLPEEDEELAMYLLIMKRLQEEGYMQYEISNFAKPGYESKHNITYWRNESYYGIGAGAHGYMKGHRHVNIKGVQSYINASKQGLPILEQFPVLREEAIEDFMMVGLRLLQGVNNEDFQHQFGCTMEAVFAPVFEKLLKQQLLEVTSNGYCLSQQGILLGNEVFAQFIGYLKKEKTLS